MPRWKWFDFSQHQNVCGKLVIHLLSYKIFPWHTRFMVENASMLLKLTILWVWSDHLLLVLLTQESINVNLIPHTILVYYFITMGRGGIKIPSDYQGGCTALNAPGGGGLWRPKTWQIQRPHISQFTMWGLTRAFQPNYNLYAPEGRGQAWEFCRPQFQRPHRFPCPDRGAALHRLLYYYWL